MLTFFLYFIWSNSSVFLCLIFPLILLIVLAFIDVNCNVVSCGGSLKYSLSYSLPEQFYYLFTFILLQLYTSNRTNECSECKILLIVLKPLFPLLIESDSHPMYLGYSMESFAIKLFKYLVTVNSQSRRKNSWFFMILMILLTIDFATYSSCALNAIISSLSWWKCFLIIFVNILHLLF